MVPGNPIQPQPYCSALITPIPTALLQAAIDRADETQSSRSGKAWAWVQFEAKKVVPAGHTGPLDIVCKAIDDQYNQQPHSTSPIWNLRGILNTSWGKCTVHVGGKARL